MAQQVLDAVVEINASGIMVLLAEQNAQAALKIAHRGYFIENGEVSLQGSKDELLDNSDVHQACMGT